MLSINGIGTRFYGITKPDEEGNCKAICWFSFVYIPLIPLWRATISREQTRPHVFKFNVIQKEKLVFKEVISTYFFGWIVMPLLIGAPMILCIREVSERLGIAVENPKGGLSDTWTVMFVIALVYFVIAILKLKSWDEKRGLVKTKTIEDV